MSEIVVVGSYVQDLAFRTERFPNPGETRIGTFAMGAGGKGFNQAVAAARQGNRVLFLGAVGDDVFRETVEKFAAQEGIELGLEVMAQVATGAAAILVNDEGENEIVVSLGASGKLSTQHIAQYDDTLRTARILLTQAECSLAATRFALECSAEARVLSIFNTAPINPDIDHSLLSLAQVITPNETEFRFLLATLFEKQIPEDYWQSSVEDLHALCRLTHCPTVVLTLGARGVFVSHAETPALGCHDSSACYFADAFCVSVLDTTGAGDAFSGGLAAGLLRSDFHFPQAVRYANATAALSTTRPGTSPSMPTALEVQRLLAEPGAPR